MTDVPHGTSRKTRRRRDTRECAAGCGGERDRPGQAYCRACHAVYMVGWRRRLAEELEQLRARLELVNAK